MTDRVDLVNLYKGLNSFIYLLKCIALLFLCMALAAWASLWQRLPGTCQAGTVEHCSCRGCPVAVVGTRGQPGAPTLCVFIQKGY